MVIIAVLALSVLIYGALPKDTSEIVALGITKNQLDSFVLKTNYLGDYNLYTVSNNSDLNIIVYFSKPYDAVQLSDINKMIVSEVKNASSFENIYISYNN